MFQMMSLAEPVRSNSPYVPPRSAVVVRSGVRNGVSVPTLHAAGDVSLLGRPAVAIVGSRHASAHGVEMAAEVARELVALGVIVVSGLAAGIDRAVHEAAIAAGGRTIGVIGTPLERAFPREHARLQERVYCEHLLLSPFGAGTVTRKAHFPRRNCVMARIALATVLVEAGERSGTVHQVRESLTVGRPVLISERLIMDPKVYWPRQFWGHPGVLVWSTAEEAAERVTGLMSAMAHDAQ